ncbi:MAG TPA: hypothetical protein DC060_21975 [Gemmatimonadetes bacterium]|nr:hypothetical protein [Gemmatimonadota bacterium]
MKEITEALTAKQTQIKKLQRDIDALMRAAGILAGGEVKAKAKAKAKAAQPKAKRTQKTMSAAARKAVSKRMKAYWAKRRKAKG